VGPAITGQVIAAAWGNQNRDNWAQSAVAKVTTAGDLVVGAGANSLARLGLTALTDAPLVANTGSNTPAWSSNWVMGSARIEPTASNTRDLGSVSFRIKDLYLAGNIDVGGVLLRASPPACRVYHSVDQSAAVGTTTLAFNSERYDNATMHDTATNNSRLTAPIAGVYLLTLTLAYVGGTTGTYAAAIRLNGATYIAWDERYVGSISTGPDFAIATTYKLAASDYVEAQVSQSTGGTRTVSAIGNWSPEFAMTWLGPG